MVAKAVCIHVVLVICYFPSWPITTKCVNYVYTHSLILMNYTISNVQYCMPMYICVQHIIMLVPSLLSAALGL